MRSFRSSRPLALVIALLVSAAAPVLAVVHGLEHEHLAHEHAAADAARSEHDATEAAHHASVAGPELEPADHGHEHAHPIVGAGLAGRGIGRMDVDAAVAPLPMTPLVYVATVVVIRSAASSDRALLARPAPESGPPPTLRAPPAS